jgi:hypothetical protein
MAIMTSGLNLSENDFSEVQTKIHTRVYGFYAA